MNVSNIESKGSCVKEKSSKKFNIRRLRLSLKYRPEILKLILKMRICIRKKNLMISKLKSHLKKEKISSRIDSSTQTDDLTLISNINSTENTLEVDSKTSGKLVKDLHTQTLDINTNSDMINSKTAKLENEEKGWSIAEENGENDKSIADQVKEVAQSALQESGMVYVESAGMYYDYKTGYYYNPVMKTEEDLENLTKNFSQDKEEDPSEKASKPKRKKIIEKKKESLPVDQNNSENSKKSDEKEIDIFTVDEKEKGSTISDNQLEDGECSDTDSEKSENEDVQSNASTSTATDDESVAKHHPPCMRVIVRETNLPKLKIGSLFLITKDGGTIGREGDQHVILIKDHNISRTHLDIRYDITNRSYLATDLGSKNGTILNGVRMSESQIVSEPLEVLHGSTIQLGETKLLCHIHPGMDTCGHCEPGLLMESHEKEKAVAYTRTCSVQKQHQLELARLKNKYAPQPLAIEETAYNDRAQARRDAVGSSHHSEKTHSADVDTFIAPENKGFKLLEKMGWSKGEGLGKDNQGGTEPVPLISNEGKIGLGATSGAPSAPPKNINRLGSSTLRLANRSKMLKPPAKAFQAEDDDSE
ncbi:angiogenic factor with G patch and FHA domains 1 isoform X3 [Galleria mellonella]|uniref:Angiogenic factor with G patch and FHA domains 1 isoform X3 n=1 Tax=Galleria mellonella TaxID=7137 RepID=A0ABM3MXL9_GALME|nr:angiogenic factor with G patch and FHA domains 1 isoform X3 [Galleria mellonella]